MNFIKKLLNIRGINTENVNMIVAGTIFFSMILWRIFKDVVIKKIKEAKNDVVEKTPPTNKRGDGIVLWASEEMKQELDKQYKQDVEKMLSDTLQEQMKLKSSFALDDGQIEKE